MDKDVECDLTFTVCRLDRSLRTCLEHTASPGLRAVADSEGKHPPYGHYVVDYLQAGAVPGALYNSARIC